jgi:hypothetical protein
MGNTNIRICSLKIIFKVPVLNGYLPGVLRFENVKNIHLTELYIEAITKYYCIDISASTQKASVSNCNIVNMGSGGGIQVRNRTGVSSQISKDIWISGNFLHSITDEPIAIFGWMGKVSNVIVENNTVVAEGASFGISAYGIDQLKHTGRLGNIIIRNNVINGSRIGGICAKGGASDVLIENNLIGNTNNDGVFIDNGGPGLPPVQRVKVIGNKISNTGRHGLYVKGADISIVSNLIQNCRSAGLFISGKGGGLVNVFNNTILLSGRSIILSGPSRGILSGNSFSKPDDILRIHD